MVLNKTVVIFAVCVFSVFLLSGFFHQPLAFSSGKAANHQVVKQTPGDRLQHCQDSPMIVNPPSRGKSYFIGKLSEKDLRQWSSRYGMRDKIPSPHYDQKCDSR